MRIVFRVDASLEIGSGHVMRCLTLAKAMRATGAICQFVSREHSGNLVDLIRNEGFEANALPTIDITCLSPDESTALAHSAWLGASWQDDAKQTIKALKTSFPDWLIVDHYALDARWERELRPHVGKIMVIDDLADRNHHCDILLDQNLAQNGTDRYKDLIPEFCRSLIGPHYALLQHDYTVLHPRTPTRKGKVERILLFFGGMDLHNLTQLSMAAFLSLKRDDIILDVVIDSQRESSSAIRAIAEKNININLHSLQPSLATLMLKADLAIGAAGATTWERCCLGLPSLVITLADNQKYIAETLHKRDLVRWLGHYDSISEQLIADNIKLAIAEPNLDTWSYNCKSLVDGRGANRVVSMMFLNTSTPVSARLARPMDEEFFQSCRCSFIEENNKNLSTQEVFNKFLRAPDSKKIYVIETLAEVAVGIVIFDLKKDVWNIIHAMPPETCAPDLYRRFIAAAILELRRELSGTLTFSMSSRRSYENKETQFSSQIPQERTASNKLSISICSDTASWINQSLPEPIIKWLDAGHRCSWAHNAKYLPGGDLCFYLSYGRISDRKTRSKYKNNLVVHASDLPKGKGWSPTTWMIIEGENRVPVSLLEAIDDVDAGDIYDQRWLNVRPTDLIDDWRQKLANITNELIFDFTVNYPSSLKSKRQQSGESTFYPKRCASDSRLNKNKTIAEQFNLLRVVDNENYPAFFEVDDFEFFLKVYKRKRNEEPRN